MTRNANVVADAAAEAAPREDPDERLDREGEEARRDEPDDRSPARARARPALRRRTRSTAIDDERRGGEEPAVRPAFRNVERWPDGGHGGLGFPGRRPVSCRRTDDPITEVAPKQSLRDRSRGCARTRRGALWAARGAAPDHLLRRGRLPLARCGTRRSPAACSAAGSPIASSSGSLRLSVLVGGRAWLRLAVGHGRRVGAPRTRPHPARSRNDREGAAEQSETARWWLLSHGHVPLPLVQLRPPPRATARPRGGLARPRCRRFATRRGLSPSFSRRRS